MGAKVQKCAVFMQAHHRTMKKGQNPLMEHGPDQIQRIETRELGWAREEREKGKPNRYLLERHLVG